jgi:hypothetical protein
MVKVLNVEHVLLVPRMSPVGIANLRGLKDQLVAYRDEIVAARGSAPGYSWMRPAGCRCGV